MGKHWVVHLIRIQQLKETLSVRPTRTLCSTDYPALPFELLRKSSGVKCLELWYMNVALGPEPDISQVNAQEMSVKRE